ncbi:hypothetical protein [Microlunatus soli]|uniref:Uncharacterized protein n=1 Tax=Microlunatus soli TaxID=630515 RepID=A0A1H1R0N8_9ACTN|nr:hypothetical protein [Microlunatus soli]SDS29212.1 hypothetical protein SAMN04489812_1461 [Microlunatus soli]
MPDLPKCVPSASGGATQRGSEPPFDAYRGLSIEVLKEKGPTERQVLNSRGDHHHDDSVLRDQAAGEK